MTEDLGFIILRFSYDGGLLPSLIFCDTHKPKREKDFSVLIDYVPIHILPSRVDHLYANWKYINNHFSQKKVVLT